MNRVGLHSFVWLAVLLVLVVGCGRVPGGSADVSPANSPGLSPSEQPSPSPTDPTATWQTFTSPSLGYTLKLPPDFHYQGSGGPPNPDDYFSNENVGSPASLDPNGIFLDIVVNRDAGDSCLNHGLNNASIERTDAVVVDAVPASLRLVSWQGTEGMSMNLLHGTYCYEIVVVAGSMMARDSYETTAQQMLGDTFRFGTGPTV